MADTPEEAVEEGALNPKRVRIGQEEVESHSLADLIKADDYLTGKDAKTNASAKPAFGLRFTKLVPPGC